MISPTIFQPKSKTHWVATITGAAGALLTWAPQAMQYIPTTWYGPIFLGLGIVFHVLRSITTKPVDAK